MKHLVFVVGMYKNGGMERRTTTLANQFAKKGYKCTILVVQEISSELFFAIENNVEIVLLDEYADMCRKSHKDKAEKKIKTKIWILKRLQHMTTCLKIINKYISGKIKLLRCGQVLSVYVSNNTESIYIPFGSHCMNCLYVASKGINIKSVYAEINSPEIAFLSKPSEKKQFLHMVSKVNGVVMQTQEELSFYKPYLANGVVIHNPIKDGLPEVYKAERRKAVVNFCRVSEQKNLPLLIEAFLIFKSTHPEYTLEIYGNTIEDAEEALLQELKKYVSERNLEKVIKFLPPRADVLDVVKDCTMFVSSSDYEGLSNSMLEAMAIGLPCVCTDCLGGGARELIQNGENGLLVPMKDVKALTTAMCRMADDERLAKKCSDNTSKIREELSAENIATQWMEYIHSVI